MAKLKVISIADRSFLGTRKDNVITGVQVSNSSKINVDWFAQYLKDKNMKEFVQIEIGANTDVVIRELTRREALDFNFVQAEWAEAVEMAEAETVNSVFDKFRGKR